MGVENWRVGHLLRILGLAFGLAVVIGGVVGQGILRTPGIVAGAVPDPTWILALWAVGGIVILIDACSLVELGASIPKEGGPYALARRAYGRVAGTVMGWADWINTVLVLSFVSVDFGEYCHRLGIGRDWQIAG
jgi:APA family basic amino acid/polyamine antiporter